MKENWANILQVKMADYKESAPEGLWESVEAGLGATALASATVVAAKNLLHAKRVSALKWFVAAPVSAAVVVTAAIVGIKALQHNPQPVQPQMAPAAIVEQPKDTSEARPVVVPSIPESAATVPADSEVSVTVSSDSAVADTSSHKEVRKEPERKKGREIVSDHLAGRIPQNGNEPVKCKISVGIFAGSLSGTGNSTYQSDSDLGDMGLPWIPGSGNVVNPLANEMNYHHKLPVHVGLMLKYDCDRRIGLRTGIVYSLLSSDVTSGDSEAGTDGKQTLHFIGVPVNVDFNFYKSKAISIYLSGGLMAEKLVDGKIRRNVVFDGQITNHETETVHVKPLYWSVNAAAGVQYGLSGNFALYAEPGIDYHFNNKTSVKTIYKDKPVEFNLSIGVVYSF